jgi:hypothetical protein
MGDTGAAAAVATTVPPNSISNVVELNGAA